MSTESATQATEILAATQRESEARKLLMSRPATGVAIWEVVLAWCCGLAVAGLLYVLNCGAITAIMAAISMAAVIQAGAACAQSRHLAARLNALETLLQKETVA